MKPFEWRFMTQLERPSPLIVDEAAAPKGPGAAYGLPVGRTTPTSPANVELHRQMADVLTAIMMQAEAVRRNSVNSRVNEAAITASCEHIVECAKRAWQLIAEQSDSSETRL
ncbi:hypothetical protein [Ancylobacter sp. 3268]|uniref:hypothetical protein n=1 Tax=Ancylobacter sp. 3268 TaxID=2817752 RepID=UPI00286C6FB7|nr:hypothetical protein [Ancylobacter sp. 3268]